MRTRASRQVTSSQPQQQYRPRTSCPGTKTGDGANINMSYQMTDRMLCDVPNGSSIVIEIVRYRDSKRPLDPTALGHRFFGGDGKVIRMTPLSLDSWIMMGYWHDDGASGPCSRGSLNADWMSSSHSDATNHETDHPDDDWDEEGENGEEDTGEYKSLVLSNDQGFSRDNMRCRRRTHIPWLESDEERLLSYKDKIGMEWKDICKRFLDRSPGAVKLRYYTLRKKDS
ncbi:hypothetical protein BDW02DRAFT_268296 [Decorospora gaudefroyi]|uniref:Myb-like domain-containing protein n=1 Tax=Decorospora gaudefroyi TaxID=184978 RepID=A0A6A5K0W3_9PLEO|nr:hypothetical protein BDW02DRAFT_268296 [Decorospora gaudefroyi]